MKVLIAEDDQFLANAYRVKLSKAGFKVLITADGEEAIKALAEFKPDVILLDLIMPNKDGFATLEEIKSSSQYKQIPVIVASNLGQKEDVDRVKKLGANDYVVKSNMKLDDLVTKIKNYA